MGFFSLFKKKEKQEQRVDYFKDLDKAIVDKKITIQLKEKGVIEVIQKRIAQLAEELAQEISVLEMIDLHNVKAEQRLKFIVLENLANYIKSLDKLKGDLQTLSSEDSESLIEKVNQVFSDFESKSRASREKVTYLVGKEIREVKDSIGKFFKDIDNFGKEEKQFFDELHLLKQSENFLKKIRELEKSKFDLEKEKSTLENEVKFLQRDLDKTVADIEKMKDSPAYEEQKNKKEQIKSMQDQLNKELLELKNSLDLKNLAKKYHHEEKKMKTIKEYEENFSKILLDENLSFLNLLEDKVRDKSLEKIYSLKEKIEEVTFLINNKNEAEQIEEDKANIEEKINSLNVENEKKQKAYEKFCEEIESLKHFIKANLDQIN